MNTAANPDWDDLRLVLLISRHGRLAAAADAAQLSNTTLFRRLRTLEARLGVRLFERLRAGYKPTRAGAELIEFAQRMDSELQSVAEGLRGRQAWPGGLIRLSVADTWMQELLPPLLASYQACHRVQLSLSNGNALADVMQGAADVVLRSGGPPPEPLVGRRLARVEATVYCSRKLGGVRPDRIADLSWVGVDDQFEHLASARWLEREGLTGRLAMRIKALSTISTRARAPSCPFSRDASRGRRWELGGSTATLEHSATPKRLTLNRPLSQRRRLRHCGMGLARRAALAWPVELRATDSRLDQTFARSKSNIKYRHRH